MLRGLGRRALCLLPTSMSEATGVATAGWGTVSRRAAFATTPSQQGEVDVVIALGTNMGNRGLNLHRGLRRLRELGLQMLRHSALYETAAAYVTDQPAFLNAAVLARTQLPPRELLRLLKQVEAEAGRDLVGGPRFGPRPLDLDIVFFGAAPFQDERLEVPHPRWRERPFVTAPVADLLYRRDTATTTGSGSTSSSSSSSRSGDGGLAGANREPLSEGHPGSVLGYLRDARRVWEVASGRHASGSSAGGSGSSGGGEAVAGAGAGVGPGGGGEVMRRVTPLVNLGAGGSTSVSDARSSSSSGGGGGGGGGSSVDALLTWGVRTHLMAIVNVTPDSFSDGGRHFPGGSGASGSGGGGGGGGVAAVVAAAERMVEEGADMIDVGGQSTRPGATRLSAAEELTRVMPVIRALRQSARLRSVPLSVDTFYAQVAREAAAGGANIVNDVSGGELDPAMRETVAELGLPYVVMHMRGDPGTMTRPEHTTYGCEWRDVGAELQARAEAAEAAGVPAWSIILDPGIGFAKTADGNLVLLRDLPLLRTQGLDGPYAGAPAGGGGGSIGGGPLLVGPSRKRFLGALTGRERPEERDAATAAACVVAVGGGADVVRVHAVREVRDALQVADAVYRGRQ